MHLLSCLAFIFLITRASTNIHNLSKGYDKNVRPSEKGPATEVYLQLAVVALGPISEKTLTVKADVFLRQWWHDERLNWKDGEIINYNVDPTNYIWVPDTFISNARETKMHKVLTKSIKTVMGPNGTIFVSARLTLECSCKMDLRVYPMDTQRCSIDFESYAFSGKEIKLDWKYPNKPVDFAGGNIQVSGYELLSVKGVKEETYYLEEPYPKLKAIFHIKRSFSYFLYHVYVPGGFLVALSWSTFFIPATAVPARVTLIVTNFLSTMFLFGSTASMIPQQPYITALEVYSLINIVFIILVMVEYIFVLKYASIQHKEIPWPKLKNPFKKDSDMELQPPNGNAGYDITESEGVNIVNSKKNQAPNGHFFDSISRLSFPFIYILILFIYFLCNKPSN